MAEGIREGDARAVRHRRDRRGNRDDGRGGCAVRRNRASDRREAGQGRAGRLQAQRPQPAAARAVEQARVPEAARLGEGIRAFLPEGAAGGHHRTDRARDRTERARTSSGRRRRSLRWLVPRPRLCDVGRRLAARHERRRRARLLHPGRQHLDRHLPQDRRRACCGVHVRLAVERDGDVVRQRQRGRPDGDVRPDRRPLVRGRLRVLGERERSAVLRVHRGLTDRRSRERRLVPLPDPRRRRGASVVPRLPEDGDLAGRPLHDGEHVPGQHVPRGSRLGVQPPGHGGGCARAQRRLRHEHGDVLQHAAEQHAHCRRRAARGQAEPLRLGVPVGLRAGDLQVPRRLLG